MRKINYTDRYILRKWKTTWRKSQLDYLGAYEFNVVEKAVVNPGKGSKGGRFYILYLQSVDEKYEGMLETVPKIYNKFKVGERFRKCSVVKHMNKEDYYIVDSEYPEEAKNKIVKSSLIGIGFTICVMILAFLGITYMIGSIIWG